MDYKLKRLQETLTLKGYTLITEIGFGSFSRVYKILKEGKYYALKVNEKIIKAN